MHPLAAIAQHITVLNPSFQPTPVRKRSVTTAAQTEAKEMLKIHQKITELIMAPLDQGQCSSNINEMILFSYQNKNQEVLRGTGLSPQDIQSGALTDTVEAQSSDLGTFASIKVLCESLALK